VSRSACGNDVLTHMRFALRANDVPLLWQCRTDDFEWLPLRSSHIQRKNYFNQSNAGQPAGCPALLFHG